MADRIAKIRLRKNQGGLKEGRENEGQGTDTNGSPAKRSLVDDIAPKSVSSESKIPRDRRIFERAMK